jgi:carboxymethylenebutenolidase
MSRRDMVRRVMYITGGVASAATILSTLGCGPSAAPSATAAPVAKPTTAAKPEASPSAAASASPSPAVKPAAVASPSLAASPSPAAGGSPLSVPPNDPSIEASEISFPNEGATIRAYQAKPLGSGPFPVVVICHENMGITPHIQDVARRYAKAGYVGCAVDLLSREGGTNGIADRAQIPSVLSNTPPERHVSDFQAAVRYYASQPIARQGAFAMTGFCFGGGIVWRTAAAIPELKAAAPYYGPPPPLSDVPNIKAAMLGIYSDDPQDFANRGRDELVAAMRQANVTFEIKVYPNTQHGFNNDTSPRYNQEASLAAWKDVQDWFGKYVKG